MSLGKIAYRNCINPECLAEQGQRHDYDCTPADPTQVASIRIMARDGEEIVPAAGTVYRTSDEAGVFTEDIVMVVMTQDQYNRIQGLLQDQIDTLRNRLARIPQDNWWQRNGEGTA